MSFLLRGLHGRRFDCLHFELDVDAVANEHAPRLKHLVLFQAEVLSVDGRCRDEADALVSIFLRNEICSNNLTGFELRLSIGRNRRTPTLWAGASDNRDSSKVADSTANTVGAADGTRTAAPGTDNGSAAGHKSNAGTGAGNHNRHMHGTTDNQNSTLDWPRARINR